MLILSISALSGPSMCLSAWSQVYWEGEAPLGGQVSPSARAVGIAPALLQHVCTSCLSCQRRVAKATLWDAWAGLCGLPGCLCVGGRALADRLSYCPQVDGSGATWPCGWLPRD